MKPQGSVIMIHDSYTHVRTYRRPCIIVSCLPEYHYLCVPCSASARNQFSSRPLLKATPQNGLFRDSKVCPDWVFSITEEEVKSVLGRITPNQLEKLQHLTLEYIQEGFAVERHHTLGRPEESDDVAKRVAKYGGTPLHSGR